MKRRYQYENDADFDLVKMYMTAIMGHCGYTQLLGRCSSGLLLWLLILSSLSEVLVVLCQPPLGRGSVADVRNGLCPPVAMLLQMYNHK